MADIAAAPLCFTQSAPHPVKGSTSDSTLQNMEQNLNGQVHRKEGVVDHALLSGHSTDAPSMTSRGKVSVSLIIYRASLAVNAQHFLASPWPLKTMLQKPKGGVAERRALQVGAM